MRGGLTLDAGALIAWERGDRRALSVIQRVLDSGLPIAVPAGAIAQTWRDGRRQARIARLLADPVVTVEPLDDLRARAAGQLCGLTGTQDVVDASVVLCARARGHAVMTSDPDDLARLGPELRLVRV